MGNLHQKLVACAMTQFIVDPLESVEVDEAIRDEFAGRSRTRNGFLESLFVSPSVGQSRQRVVEGQTSIVIDDSPHEPAQEEETSQGEARDADEETDRRRTPEAHGISATRLIGRENISLEDDAKDEEWHHGAQEVRQIGSMVRGMRKN